MIIFQETNGKKKWNIFLDILIQTYIHTNANENNENKNKKMYISMY